MYPSHANTPIAIRRFQPEDAEQVWHLHNVVLAETGAHLGPGPWDDDLKNIEEHYLNSNGEFLVAEYQSEVRGKFLIAMGALRRLSEDRGEIKRMRVLREFQGQGIGKTILRTLEARARELGYKILQLDTTTLQEAAQGLYRNAGYQEIRREKGQGLEVIIFEKNL